MRDKAAVILILRCREASLDEFVNDATVLGTQRLAWIVEFRIIVADGDAPALFRLRPGVVRKNGPRCHKAV